MRSRTRLVPTALAALQVLALGAVMQAQGPAPAPTIGDLVKQRGTTRTAQDQARAARDAAQAALTAADQGVADAAARVKAADDALVAALVKLNRAVLVDTTVYRPLPDGTIDVFDVLPAETPADPPPAAGGARLPPPPFLSGGRVPQVRPFVPTAPIPAPAPR